MKEMIATQALNELSSISANGFCKPKVGSSILSTGTTKSLLLLGFSRFSGVGNVGRSGEEMRFYQPQNQDHLFPARSRLPRSRSWGWGR